MDTAPVEKVKAERRCRWCETAFTKSNLTYYCSLDHRYLYRNKYRAEWQRRYYARVKRPTLKLFSVTKCANCGGELGRERLKKYCSDSCSYEVNYKRTRERMKNKKGLENANNPSA